MRGQSPKSWVSLTRIHNHSILHGFATGEKQSADALFGVDGQAGTLADRATRNRRLRGIGLRIGGRTLPG